MRIAWFDSVAGVSGDMFVGALIDAGAPFDAVKAAVDALGLSDVRVQAQKVISHSIAATSFSVVDAAKGRPVEEVGGDFHRHPSDLYRIIENAGLPDSVRRNAVAVIKLLAKAEAAVHGVSEEEVHFHEVGALDTVVDSVAAAAAMEALGVGSATSSPVKVGGGEVMTMHGRLPVPAPATLILLKGARISHGGIDMELTTPTGAALLRHYASSFGPVPEMTVLAAGYGAGKREIGSPNLFRVLIGTP